MGKIQYTNIDNIAPHPGDIAVLSNENASAVVGLANSNSLVILGTWIDSPNPGFVGTVENDNVYVNCEVLPSLGDRLYLSAANKGQVTNTAPPNAYFVGSVLQIGQQIGAYYQIQTIFNKYGSPLATAVSPGTMPATRITQVQLNQVSDALTNGGVGTFGSALTTWDLAGLGCDTKGAFLLTVEGIAVASASHALSLRVNGATTNLALNGWYSVTSTGPFALNGGASSLFLTVNSAGGIAGTYWTINMACPAPRSGKPRQFFVDAMCYTNPTTLTQSIVRYVLTYTLTDEIVSVGVVSSVAANMAAASAYNLRRI
jgi:hypothetical protein